MHSHQPHLLQQIFNSLYQSTIPLIICTQIFSHNNHVILEPYRLFPYIIQLGRGWGGTFSDEHVFKCVNPLASYQVPEHLHTPGRGHSRHYMQHQYKCLFFEDLLGFFMFNNWTQHIYILCMCIRRPNSSMYVC